MVLFEIFLNAALLTSASAYVCSDIHRGPCKRTSQCELKVTPKNTTHLMVSWANFLEEECEQKYIEGVEIVVQKNGYEEKRIPVPPNQKSATVEADPCKSHIVVVKFDFTRDYLDNHGRSRVQSPNIGYNTIVDNEFPDPFGGLLAKELVSKICLKKNGTIHIPKAPAALSKCDVLSGDVEDSDFQGEGTTANMKITFKHTVQPDHKTYEIFEVKNIKGCSSSTTNTDSKLGINFFDN